MSRILLLVMLLFSSAASAYQYCVNFPTDGNSKWSKRDNYMQIRMGVDYSVERITRTDDLSNDAISIRRHNKTGRIRQQNRGDFNKGYFKRWYGSGRHCVDMTALEQGYKKRLLDSYKDVSYLSNTQWFTVKSGRDVRVTGYFMDVRWGKDCPKVKNDGNYTLTIYRRKHNHTNPWGCKW